MSKNSDNPYYEEQLEEEKQKYSDFAKEIETAVFELVASVSDQAMKEAKHPGLIRIPLGARVKKITDIVHRYFPIPDHLRGGNK